MATPTTPDRPDRSVRKHWLFILIILVLIGGIYVLLNYVLPGGSSGSSTGTEPMKIPESNTIRTVGDFGKIPVHQFGVVLQEGKTKTDAEAIAKNANGVITGEISLIGFYQIEIASANEGNYTQLFEKLAGTPGVEFAVPNGLIIPDGFDESKGTCDPLDDPIYKEGSNGRNYEMIGLKNAYAYMKASGLSLNAVKVGVLDTRLYKPCDELGGSSSVSTTDKEDYNDDPEKDENGQITDGGLTHATMVNEVLGANADNGGVTGVGSPLGDKLTVVTTNIYKTDNYEVSTPDPDDPTKVVSNGVTFIHTSLKAMMDQIKSGATVINCSYGPKDYSENHTFETRLYEKFYKKIQEKYPKVVIVGSAGNSNFALNGNNGANKGQKVGNLLTVGSLDVDGRKSSYSNYATGNGEVSISAPADDVILGTDKNGNPITASGTSLAAPQVAGTVALIQSLNPDLTALEIKNILQATADRQIEGKDQTVVVPAQMGSGMLRVDKAVLKVINDLRAKKGLPPLTPEILTLMNQVDLGFSGGPENYSIKAGIKALQGNKTVLVLDITGNDYAISGSNKKTLTEPGEVTWNVSVKAGEKITAKVSRSDTKACSWVVIEPVSISGKWDVTGVITEAKLDPKIYTYPNGQMTIDNFRVGKEVSMGQIDIDQWKKFRYSFSKEGNTIVIGPPSDGDLQSSTNTYYIEQLTNGSFSGYMIYVMRYDDLESTIRYRVTGTRIP
ncbi:MAG: S8/S53 family peptidase [Chitinophagaceae bacterium]|nr:S8/S53 family peptidase [Chitinophagaceae bacterium]